MPISISSYTRNQWRRGLVTGSTSTAFPNTGAGPIATVTKPVTVDDASTPTSNAVVIQNAGTHTNLIMFGTNADNEQYKARLVLWVEAMDKIGETAAENASLWIPIHIGTIEVTLSSAVGIALSPIIATDFFADTIGGTVDANRVTINAQADNIPAIVSIDTTATELLGVYFDIDALTTNAASANLVWSTY